MEERRKFVRIKDLDKVEVRVKKKLGKMEVVEVKDISISGIKFYYGSELEKDQIVQLEIALPDELPALELEGKVFWQISGTGDKFATGVRFQHEDKKQEERLSKFIESRAKNVGEGRSSIRCDLQANVAVSDLNNSEVKFSGTSVDISNGGMKLLVPEKMEIGKEVKLTFNVPGDRYTITAKALVVWSRADKNSDKFSSGIVFTEIDNVAKDIISKFVKSSCQK